MKGLRYWSPILVVGTIWAVVAAVFQVPAWLAFSVGVAIGVLTGLITAWVRDLRRWDGPPP